METWLLGIFAALMVAWISAITRVVMEHSRDIAKLVQADLAQANEIKVFWQREWPAIQQQLSKMASDYSLFHEKLDKMAIQLAILATKQERG